MADPSSLRLALVCPYSLSRPGGVQGQVLGLARAYRNRGHDVAVFAPFDGPDAVLSEATDLDGVELVSTGRPRSVPANGSVAPVVLSPTAARRAVTELRARGVDVVHVHEPFAPGAPLALALTGRRPPEVATFHRSGASRAYRAIGPLSRRLGRRFAARCAVSRAARDTAGAVVDGEIEVLFNGVECDRFGHVPPWPSDRPAILFLGRHESRKGLEVLLEAFDRLRRAPGGVDAELWVAGDGPDDERLRHRWPPADDLRWLGTISDEEKHRRLAGAEVLCAPSLGQESFGLVLLEGMASRTVVVASDIDGYRDAAGGRAVLVAPGRADALAEALSAVLAGELAAEPAGQPGAPSGRERWLDLAEAHAGGFSMAHLAERYDAVMRRVLEAGAPARS